MTKIAVIIPTCDEARKPFLDFLMDRLARQTKKPDHVIVVDYQNNGSIDITDRFKKGLNDAISLGCELIISMEDDDYYPLSYIERLEKAWIDNGKPKIIGHKQTINYNIIHNTYRVVDRLDRASAYCTAVSKDVNFDIKDQIWDYEAWRINKGKLVSILPPPVGIKHGVGMTGGHEQSVCDCYDFDHKILKSIVDSESYEFYQKLIPILCGTL